MRFKAGVSGGFSPLLAEVVGQWKMRYFVYMRSFDCAYLMVEMAFLRCLLNLEIVRTPVASCSFLRIYERTSMSNVAA